MVTGGTTGLWYALPDLVASPRRRAAVKAGVVAAQLAYVAWAMASEAHSDAGTPTHPTAAARDPETAGTTRDPETAGTTRAPETAGAASGQAVDHRPDEDATARAAQAVVVVLGAVVLTVALAANALFDRGVRRVGERMVANGVRRPYVRIGVVLGVVAGVGAALGEDLPGSGAVR